MNESIEWEKKEKREHANCMEYGTGLIFHLFYFLLTPLGFDY